MPRLFRAYLASDGNDANACTLPQPCRLLQRGLAAVASGGEIWLLDSANYNTATVMIDKSVSILAIPGAVGSVLAINQPSGGIAPPLATPAIRISAAGLLVSLRNLVIVPSPGSANGTSGVELSGGSVLGIEHSVIANMPSHGVSVYGAGMLRITNSVVRSNGYAGVHLQAGAKAEISGTQLLGNAIAGVYALSTGGSRRRPLSATRLSREARTGLARPPSPPATFATSRLRAPRSRERPTDSIAATPRRERHPSR